MCVSRNSLAPKGIQEPSPTNFKNLKNNDFSIFTKNNWPNLAVLAPEKDSPGDLEEIPQQIVQKYALAATFLIFWGPRNFGKQCRKQRYPPSQQQRHRVSGNAHMGFNILPNLKIERFQHPLLGKFLIS